MAIALTIQHGPHEGLKRPEILRRIRAMIRLLHLEKTDISFVITDDKSIHQLNKIYRGKNRPTDVLAFAMREGEFGALAGQALGDVIVSAPTARKQAVSARTPILEEVTMLLAHGLLHLLGWDHETAAKNRHMQAETARLCTAAALSRSKAGATETLSQKPSASRRARPAGKTNKDRRHGGHFAGK